VPEEDEVGRDEDDERTSKQPIKKISLKKAFLRVDERGTVGWQTGSEIEPRVGTDSSSHVTNIPSDRDKIMPGAVLLDGVDDLTNTQTEVFHGYDKQDKKRTSEVSFKHTTLSSRSEDDLRQVCCFQDPDVDDKGELRAVTLEDEESLKNAYEVQASEGGEIMMALDNIHDYLAEKAGEIQRIVAALDKDRERYRRDRVSVFMNEEVGALFDLIDQKYKPAKQAYKSFKLILGVDKGTADDVREQATKIYVQRRFVRAHLKLMAK
jgi:urease accessory protein UreE